MSEVCTLGCTPSRLRLRPMANRKEAFYGRCCVRLQISAPYFAPVERAERFRRKLATARRRLRLWRRETV